MLILQDLLWMAKDVDELTSEISPTLFSFKMRSIFIKLNYCLSSAPSLLLKDSASPFISNHVFEPITNSLNQF